MLNHPLQTKRLHKLRGEIPGMYRDPMNPDVTRVDVQLGNMVVNNDVTKPNNWLTIANIVPAVAYHTNMDTDNRGCMHETIIAYSTIDVRLMQHQIDSIQDAIRTTQVVAIDDGELPFGLQSEWDAVLYADRNALWIHDAVENRYVMYVNVSTKDAKILQPTAHIDVSPGPGFIKSHNDAQLFRSPWYDGLRGTPGLDASAKQRIDKLFHSRVVGHDAFMNRRAWVRPTFDVASGRWNVQLYVLCRLPAAPVVRMMAPDYAEMGKYDTCFQAPPADDLLPRPAVTLGNPAPCAMVHPALGSCRSFPIVDGRVQLPACLQ